MVIEDLDQKVRSGKKLEEARTKGNSERTRTRLWGEIKRKCQGVKIQLTVDLLPKGHALLTGKKGPAICWEWRAGDGNSPHKQEMRSTEKNIRIIKLKRV